MKEKIKIQNSFFDFIGFMLSTILSFFRSIAIFIDFAGIKAKNKIFFDFLDFLFNIWPRYFWKKPSLYKITSFFGDIVDFIFFKKK